MNNKIFFTLIVFLAIGNISYAATNVDTTITLKVKGVTCKNDLTTLSTNVQALNGVAECKALKGGAVSSFSITYNPALVTNKEIMAAFENTEGCSDPNSRPYKIKN